jgi:4-hydroxy-tetrahydrodipicolinate reductase
MVRVVVLGTGQMGSGIVRLLLEKPGLALVGVHARRRERTGRDVGEIVGLGAPLGLAVEADLRALLARTRPQVVLQATCSRLAEAEAEIVAAIDHGAHVVSIAEELAWPAATDRAWATRIGRRAAERGVAVLGAGVNPGFVLDLLPIVLSGVCAEVEAITATRVSDLAPYGPSVLRSQGVGLSREAFEKGVAAGSVVGHVGFPASMAMIAAALGWEIERVEEARAPIVARVRRQARFATVEPGAVAGCLHRAVAFRAGRPAITLIHPQQVCPEAEGIETGDTLEIAGRPPLCVSIRPEIPGGVATVALAVNAIPRVLAAPPGLRSITELPPLAAMPGGARATRASTEHRGG